MSWDAILFDCDGVLLDSEPAGCAALACAITAAGRPMTQDEAALIFSGNAGADNLPWLAREGLDESVFAEADRLLYEAFAQHVPIIAGIARALAFDVPMAVCSNSGLDRLARSLRRTPLAARFGPHIYSAEHVARPKPAPDLAIFAAARLGVAPQRAIFIDDNHHGIHCARSAGCLAIGFIGPSEHRAGHADRLRAAGAHHVVHGADALCDLLHSLSLPLLQETA